jgi:hypothetical protein
MRFATLFTSVLAAVSSVAALSVQPRTGSSVEMSPRNLHEFASRQVVAGTVCATVGPVVVLGITVVPVSIDSRPINSLYSRLTDRVLYPEQNICLCTEAGVLTPESLARLQAQIRIAQTNNPLLNTVTGLLGNTVALLTGQVGLQAISESHPRYSHLPLRTPRSPPLPPPAATLPTLSPCARVPVRPAATLDVTTALPDATVHVSLAPRSALPTRPGSEIRLPPGFVLRTGWPAPSTAVGRPLGNVCRYRPTLNRVVDAPLSVRVPIVPLFRESTMFR